MDKFENELLWKKKKVVNHFPLFTKVLKFSSEELPALLRLQTHHIVHGQPHSSGYRYSRTDTVEAMTALGRQPKVGKCVYICVGGGGGGGGGGIQSAEAEIGQMVTVWFKRFVCPL